MGRVIWCMSTVGVDVKIHILSVASPVLIDFNRYCVVWGLTGGMKTPRGRHGEEESREE